MRRALLGLYTYFEFFFLAVVFVPILGSVALLFRSEPGRRTRGRWMRRFGRLTSRLTPMWRFSTDGSGPADIRQRPYVVVSNHESTADPFLLSYFPWDMRWVGKEELWRLPLLGWLLKFGGDIPLRRGDRESVTKMMKICKETLAEGVPVLLFPRGHALPRRPAPPLQRWRVSAGDRGRRADRAGRADRYAQLPPQRELMVW